MRCHIDPDSWSGPLLGPSPAESHYLTHVLRLRAGDRVEIFDGRGRVGEGRIADATRDAVQVEVIEQHSVARPIPAVVLLQAVPKGKRMEWVLEKAVELGVAEIRPLWTEHTVVKLDEPRAARRVKRWKDIMLSAARQCGTAWMPELLPPVTLPEQLRAAETFPACTLLCDLDPGSASIHDALSQAHAAGETSIGILIGPEGDFSPDEKRLLREAGARSVGLGDTVLRTETAALFVIGAVRYEWL